MGLRGKLRRLERGAREGLASFILKDGSRYYYDPSFAECFLHACECVRAGSEGGPFPEAAGDDKSSHEGTQQSRGTGGNLWWWLLVCSLMIGKPLRRARRARPCLVDTPHRGHELVADERQS